MKYFITSDVHGFYTPLKKALHAARFNAKEDTLVSLGDNFDRGNQAWEVYQLLTRLPHVILVRGNHEDLFCDMVFSQAIYSHDKTNGTADTLRQISRHYFPEDWTDYYYDLSCIYETEFFRWMTDIRIWKNEVVFGDYVCTHATRPNRDFLTWKEARWANPYTNRVPGKILVAGHWYAFLGRAYESGVSPEDKYIPDVDKDDLSSPYVDKDLIMIDACTPLSGQVNVIVYDDATGKMTWKGRML